MSKRDQWITTCVVFGTMWLLIGFFIWPLLFFALVSFMMIMVPVGVSDAPPAPPPTPEGWKHD